MPSNERYQCGRRVRSSFGRSGPTGLGIYTAGSAVNRAVGGKASAAPRHFAADLCSIAPFA